VDGAKVSPVVDVNRDHDHLDVEELDRGVGGDRGDPLERERRREHSRDRPQGSELTGGRTCLFHGRRL
jgi:hypothetical protein